MSKFAFSKMNKLLKFNYNFSPVLHNRFVLYFFLVVVIIEIVYFIGSNDIVSLVTLLLVGLLTSFFNKNMTIVLVLALVTTNILKFGIKTNERFEGNQNMNENSPDNKKDNSNNNVDASGNKINKSDNKKDNSHNNENDASGNKVIISDNTLNETDSNSEEPYDNLYDSLKQEYPQFKVVQQEILDGVKKMEPLLEKAEKFIDKFGHYKTKESFSRHIYK
jgi:hypothetical protein